MVVGDGNSKMVATCILVEVCIKATRDGNCSIHVAFVVFLITVFNMLTCIKASLLGLILSCRLLQLLVSRAKGLRSHEI